MPFARGLVTLEDMLRFHAQHYVALSRIFSILGGFLEKQPPDTLLSDSVNMDLVRRQIAYGEEHLQSIGLQLCFGHLLEIKAKCESPEKYTIRTIKGEFFELYKNILREMKGRVFYYVPEEYAKFSDSKEPLFGIEVFQRFPRVTYDIEEAGKCLAFGRSTACVFHLMRVMEEGLKELAKGLGIPYAPSWESYLNQIETRITEKHGKKSRKWKTEEPFYRDVAGDLQIVKIAWRNPTMHIVRTYTPEEAEDVFRAVKGLMKRLATRFGMELVNGLRGKNE